MLLNDVLGQCLSLPTNQVESDVLSIAKIAIACLQTIPHSHDSSNNETSFSWPINSMCLAKPLHIITLGEIADVRGLTV